MQRDDQGNVRPLAVRQRLLLLLPRGQLGVSDTVWERLKQRNTPDGSFEVIDTTEKNSVTPDEATVENLRTRAGGIARNRMHRLEIAMIDRTDGLRNQHNWLILDGAVKLDEFIYTRGGAGSEPAPPARRGHAPAQLQRPALSAGPPGRRITGGLLGTAPAGSAA